MREPSSTDGVLSHERNWSELPKDILHLFSKKLSDISEFIRFRAVCKSWQLSAPINDPPPQLPWLLESCNYFEENTIIRFYCLLSGKVHTLTWPTSHRARLSGPACHYLLASCLRNNVRYLLNPLTHDQIHVPSVNALDCGRLDYIGPDTNEGSNIVVISGYADRPRARINMLAFWRPKADDWVYIEGVDNSPNAFYRGQYFSIERRTGITNVIDISTKNLAYQVAPPKGTNPHLQGCTIMVSSGGKMLRLFQYYEGELCHFDIYCLYFGDRKEKPCWVKITDIGEEILFLNHYGGLSFCASNFAGFKGNCIYFLKNKIYLCRYDIGDGTTEVLPCPLDLLETWYSRVKARFETIDRYSAECDVIDAAFMATDPSTADSGSSFASSSTRSIVRVD
ncbi:putative F-box/kelch-repeat protein At5g24040 [Carex rostrata]